MNVRQTYDMRLDEILDNNQLFGFRVLDGTGVVIKFVFDLSQGDAEAMAQHYQIRYFRPGREDTLNYKLQILYRRKVVKEFWMDADGEVHTKLISRRDEQTKSHKGHHYCPLCKGCIDCEGGKLDTDADGIQYCPICHEELGRPPSPGK